MRFLQMSAIAAMILAPSAFGGDKLKNLSPGLETWKCPDGYDFASGDGPNGTPALHYVRRDAKKYILASNPVKGLKPFTRYRFGVKVKTRDVSVFQSGHGAAVCIEYQKNGRYLGGSHPVGISGTKDWTDVSGLTVSPADFSLATMTLYLRSGHTGEAWFAEPYIYEEKPEWYTDVIYPYMKYALSPGEQTLVFNSYPVGAGGGPFTVRAVLLKDGKTVNAQTVSVKEDRYELKLPLEKGRYEIRLKLSGCDSGSSLERTVSLAVPSGTPGKNAVFIDQKGRAVVNGRKFLPVGLFFNQMGASFRNSGNVWRQEEFDALKHSPFNCIMPYDAMLWRRKESPLRGLAETRSIMDELDRLGIKVIFSLKDIHGGQKGWKKLDGHKGVENVTEYLVSSLRDHPALLAWYLNDEQTVDSFRLRQRERVSLLDPWHPTWQCQCIPRNFFQAAGGADIFGVDPYPIRKGAGSDMKEILHFFQSAGKAFSADGKSSVWGIPQIFPWSNYSKNFACFPPTGQQMRSMNLLMAILGAKGFIFFSYPDLLKPELLAGKEYSFRNHWNEVCHAARLLRNLAEYLLSDRIPPETTVRNKSGEVYAASFMNEAGKTATLIAAVGPGNSEAVVVVKGKSTLKSKYGKTTHIAGGQYLFTGKGIDSDVLEE